jgi:hypothetical protein
MVGTRGKRATGLELIELRLEGTIPLRGADQWTRTKTHQAPDGLALLRLCSSGPRRDLAHSALSAA